MVANLAVSMLHVGLKEPLEIFRPYIYSDVVDGLEKKPRRKIKIDIKKTLL